MSEGAIIAIIGFFATAIATMIAFRTTAFNELKVVLTEHKDEIDKIKKERKEEAAEYEKRIAGLEKQIDNYKRYITRLIRQLVRAGLVPDKMED